MEEGLPSSTVYDIIQARDGAIWFATDNGVSRFDGYTFEYFGVNEGLPHPDVFVLHEDDSGKIWCGVMNNELCYIENGKVVISKYAQNLSAFFKGVAIIQGIHLVGEELYLSYKYSGLVHVNSNGVVRKMDEDAFYQIFLTGKEENLFSALEARKINLGMDYELSIFDENGLVERRKFRHYKEGKSMIAPKRSCYGTMGELRILTGCFDVFIDSDSVEVKTTSIGNNQIIRQGDRVWSGSQGSGLFLTDNTQNREYQMFSKGIFIPELLDDDGNVWIVETGVGAHCFKPFHIWNYEIGEELSESLVTKIFLENDQLAVGYESGVIDMISMRTVKKNGLCKGAHTL